MVWLLGTLLILQLLAAGATDNSLSCLSPIRSFDPHTHKETYRVGVHAIRGFDEAMQEYNKTFGEYLSMTAGKRFDRPIKFEMIPITSVERLFQAAENEEVDFFFATPSLLSCVGTELGAQAIATVVSRKQVRGHTYDLDVFGGVIATRSDNDEINTIQDLKDKVIGAGSISTLMTSQSQFFEMEKAAMSYVMDPKQVVFTGNEEDIVKGLLNGDFDVGFLRTGQIELTQDSNGTFIDPDTFKVIEQKINIMDDGQLFPFLHSTLIFPEWPLATLTHVPQDVTREVQDAILAAAEHANVGRTYQDCIAVNSVANCSFPLGPDSNPNRRCDTTKRIANLALEASKQGRWAGFRTARSYFKLRSIQETAGFMFEDEKGSWKCTRSSSLYDGITCPPGHLKMSKAAFESSCEQANLTCKEGYDCFCKPCVKAFDVDVYEYSYGTEDRRVADGYIGDTQQGCEKMSICGKFEQTKSLTLRTFDSMKGMDTNITAFMYIEGSKIELNVSQVPNTFAYEFNVTAKRVGFNIVEIFANDKQISESPILVQVIKRDCESDFVGERRVASIVGSCVCYAGATEIRGHCISSIIIFSSAGVLLILILLEVGYLYLNHKKREADMMWIVSIDELHFSEPVDIIGQGSFGVVLLAEYRGTKVAVKRVMPPRGQNGESADSVSGASSSADSSMDQSPDGQIDVEAQNKDLDSKESVSISGTNSFSPNKEPPKAKLSRWFASWYNKKQTYSDSTNVLLSTTASVSSSRIYAWCPMLDKYSQQKKDFIEEMRLLSRLRHPCITTVMGAVMSPVHEPMLVMEYMDYGSLHDLLRNETMHTRGEVILQIVRDIAQGLRYLHASKPPILHGDLKSKNILVDSRFRAKVGDFGLSTKKKNCIRGTYFWMAPEYLQGRTDYTAQCDMYSLGIVLYEIYARKNPFEGENPRDVFKQICNPRINKRPPIPGRCPQKMADVMKKCWSPDPVFRPSSKELDLTFMDMNIQDVEPLEIEAQNFKNARAAKTTQEVLYEVFPKHIADALNAGKKVEPESHEMVTVVFSDIVGFTDISSQISPMKVSNMLDRLYLAFDKLARKHEIFKVETIGDAYMGVTNLNGSQKDDHAKRIAEFSLDLIDAAGKIAIDEDDATRGFVTVRVGFHSGPVVSNVIGSLNPRYGLFGDTVNTASRMESNAEAARVLCSETSATLLRKQAPDIPLARRKRIGVKGKGNLVTFWVGEADHVRVKAPKVDGSRFSRHVVFEFENVNKRETETNVRTSEEFVPNDAAKLEQRMRWERALDTCSTSQNVEYPIDNSNLLKPEKVHPMNKDTDRLVNCIVVILLDSIKKVISVRNARGTQTTGQDQTGTQMIQTEKCYLDEAKTVIVMPSYNASIGNAMKESKAVRIPPKLVTDLHSFVALIASNYRNNLFHNFRHSCHVTIAMHKMIQLILTPNFGAEQLHLFASSGKDPNELLHDFSYGLSSDPMTLFAMVFTTLIHDVDHRGISNAQLIMEEPDMATKYGLKSVAEQNSFDIAWQIFMSDQFKDIRQFIFASENEFLRFRRLVVKMMMATDMFDKESRNVREATWDRAFGTHFLDPLDESQAENWNDTCANLMLEYIIQACDVSHTMQHWNVYQKWNKSLFMEMQDAYHQGCLDKSPADFWYDGELVFFDEFVIPLARKLKECNMLGTNSDDCLNYALSNRAQWIAKGQDVVREMIAAFPVARGDEEKKDY